MDRGGLESLLAVLAVHGEDPLGDEVHAEVVD
jgi:hypothetical protein